MLFKRAAKQGGCDKLETKGTLNSMNSKSTRLCLYPILCRATIVLLALAWSSLAFGSEIHDAAKSGDLEKVKVLLKTNPAFVFSKDDHGEAPLLCAAAHAHKDVAEFLLTNKGCSSEPRDCVGVPCGVATYNY